MQGLDLNGVTVPVFTGVFGLGWGMCYTILVRPLRAELDSLRAKVDSIEKDKDERIKALEKKAGLWTD
jgi:hypothetical protein